jgi:hypothetical protein
LPRCIYLIHLGRLHCDHGELQDSIRLVCDPP